MEARRASVDMYLHPCHRRCRHCFASQGPSVGGLMSVEQFRRYTTLIQGAASRADPLFDGWDFVPFADGLHHPDILRLLEHLAAIGYTSFSGFSSDCWRVAHDPDWEGLLDGLAAYHATGFQVTMYGMERTHDWFAGKRGSFAATSCAVDRLLARGFAIWWCVYLHERNASEVDHLLAWIRAKAPNARIHLATFHFAGRGDEHRDLALSASSLDLLSPQARSCLSEELHTEREWWQLAVDGRFPEKPIWKRLHRLVLLSVLHDGAVAGGPDNEVALGHLESDSIADIVARYDRLALPAYEQAREQEREVLVSIARQSAPRSESRLLSARNQLLVWKKRIRASA